MTIVNRTLRGFLSPLEGLRLIFSSRRNFIFAAIPFGIGIFFVFLGYFAASSWFEPAIQSWVDNFEFVQSWPIIGGAFNFLVLTFSWILISLLNFIAAYICIIIVGGPFYALMVENIFKDYAQNRDRRGSVALMINMFLLALAKILVFTLIGIVCFILAFFPVINVISSYILILLVAFDCADYAFEIDFMTLRQRFRFVWEHLWEFTGLSFAIVLTGFLPGSFFILLPVFICGATKMYIQLPRNAV